MKKLALLFAGVAFVSVIALTSSCKGSSDKAQTTTTDTTAAPAADTAAAAAPAADTTVAK